MKQVFKNLVNLYGHIKPEPLLNSKIVPCFCYCNYSANAFKFSHRRRYEKSLTPIWNSYSRRLSSQLASKSQSYIDEEETQNNKNTIRKSVSSEDDDFSWGEKVLYSTYLQQFQPNRSFRYRIIEKSHIKVQNLNEIVSRTFSDPPLSCKYLDDNFTSINEEDNNKLPKTIDEDENSSSSVHFPFKVFTKTQNEKEVSMPETKDNKIISEAEKLEKVGLKLESLLDLNKESNTKDVEEDSKLFDDLGTADPRVLPSEIPCGGCGAHLHCTNTSIPGYIPSERFKSLNTEALRGEICLRCFCLQNHHAALNINISPEDYTNTLMAVKDRFSMVILLVDLTDFPCSIWPGMIDIIGTKRPVFLVGNKVDLLPRDSEKYLSHVRNCLTQTARDAGLRQAKIIHTALISAATGFGVENLISNIYELWGMKGDIFILGCTNVGKSSLFNALIQSDLCKTQVIDLVQRATISQWPGTTLNLLKFPVMRADPLRMASRQTRLLLEHEEMLLSRKERALFLRETKDPQYETLVGRIGQTFLNSHKEESASQPIIAKDMFRLFQNKVPPRVSPKVGEWDPSDYEFREGHWCYDTPGTVSENQMLDMLTLPELMKTLPKKLIKPRTYFIKVGMTMFVGGLARIDFIDGGKPIRFTAFTSDLPITIVQTEDADFVYEKALGTPIFGVPEGNKERLSKFPSLMPNEFELEGTGQNYSCGDIVLSSAGWVAVTVGIKQWCKLKVHTPNGKGVFCRQPALLPHAVNFKGPRIRDTPAYLPHKVFMPNLQGKLY